MKAPLVVQPDCVLQIHFWREGSSKTQTFCYDGRTFYSPDGNSETKTKVYRVVYFPLASAANKKPLLVIDVHDAATEVRLEPRRLSVEGEILCFLQPEFPYVPLETALKPKAGNVLAYSELTIAVSHKHGTGDDLSALIAATGERAVDLHIDRVNFDAIKQDTLELATGLRLPRRFPGDRCAPRVDTLMYFVPRKSYLNPNLGSRPDFHVLKFGLTEHASECPDGTRTAKALVSDYTIPPASRPVDWRVEQRPQSEMDAGPSTDPAARWILHAYGLPGFITATEWNGMFESRYRKPLLGVLGGRAVSFLPKLPQSPVGSWVLTYRVTDRQPKPSSSMPPAADVVQFKRLSDVATKIDGKILCEPVSIHLETSPPGKAMSLDVDLPAIHDVNGKTLAARRLTLQGYGWLEDLERLSGLALHCQGPVIAVPSAVGTLQHRPVVRMGSLDLEFASDQESPTSTTSDWFIIRPETPDLASVHIDAHFLISDVYPGGQDDPAGEEFVARRSNGIGDGDPCQAILLSSNDPNDPILRERTIEASFRSKPPIVVDLTRVAAARSPTTTKKTTFQLRVAEDAQPGANQAVRLQVLSNKPLTQFDAGGTDPCIIKADQVDQMREVLVLDRNPFLVAKVRYLPFDQVGRFNSSAIAEWATDNPESASWQLQFNQQPFCLVLPPQGVGEDMVKPGEDQPDQSGPVQFRFSPAARLTLDPRTAQTRFAEAPWNLRRILGTPGQPFPGPFVKRMQYELLYGLSCDAQNPMVRLAEIFARVGRIAPRRDPEILWPATADQSTAYYNERFEWADLYRRYLSRVAILEPWNSLLPSPDDKSINLIEGLTCKIRKGDMRDPIDGTTGLRGGATWGFESRNVYSTVFTPPSSASISDLELSSLGGWGRQKAAFQNNLTKIYADVAMGRTYTYKLERLGRIAVFWNLAKHVIVYERTVAPSKQFFAVTSKKMYGWPVLRKVREYIEILEDVRTFPDDESFATSLQRDMAKQARGPVASCTFEKGAQFNVSSAWGGDLGNTGWKVPLWNAGAVPAVVYPKPKIALGIYSNVNETPQITPCEIARPENVFFYTQTKTDLPGGNLSDGVGGDPHKWAPVRDVDYVDFTSPSARTDFNNGDMRQLTPDDVAVPPAFGPCTFQLVNAGIQANLMMDRSAATAMSAVLESVTMVRSKIKDAAAAVPAVTTLKQVQDQAVELYAKVLGAIPAELPTDTEIRKQITANILAEKNKAIASYTAKLDEAMKLVKTVQDNLKARIAALESELAKRLSGDVQAFAGNINADYEARAQEIINAFQVENAKTLVRSVQRAVSEKISVLESLPGAAGALLARYVESARRLQAAILALPGLAVQTQAAAIGAIEQVREAYSGLIHAGVRRAAEWIPDPTQQILGLMKDALGSFDSALADLENAVASSKSAQDLRDAVAAFQKTAVYDKFRNVKLDVPPEVIQSIVRTAFGLTGEIKDKDIDDRIHLAQTFIADVQADWNKFCQDRLSELDVTGTALEKFKDSIGLLKSYLTAVDDGIQKRVAKLAKDVNDQIDSLVKLFNGELDTVQAALNQAGAAIEKALNQELEKITSDLRNQRDQFAKQAGDYLDKTFRGLLPDGIGDTYQAASNTLSLIRAFGEPPKTPQLDFDRGKLGYFFKEAEQIVDVTPVLARVNQAAALASQGAAILDQLKPLGVCLPALKLSDQLIPASLRAFDVSKILPKFAGLDLSHLLAGLKMPAGIASDAVKITHGLDPQTRRAFVRSDIDFQSTEVATLFTIGPVCLQMPKARFQASTLVDAGLDGVVKRKVNGKISGDWQLVISSQPLVRFRDTTLSFDDSGGIQFSANPKNLELPGVMAFISDALSTLSSADSGLSIGLLPDGFQSILSLPVPDIESGTFGISGLRVGALFAVRFVNGKFVLNVGFNLARKEMPFALTIFILGGGGYLDARAIYQPDNGNLGCQISVGITANASLAISLGPIRGGVYVYLGITGEFQTGAGLTIGIMFLVRGEVNILGIVTAAVSLLLEATYQSSSGTLVGHGRLSISIKICWCFTLDVNEEVTYTLAGGNKKAKPTGNLLLATTTNEPGGALSSAMAGAAEDEFTYFAKQYVAMFV